MQKTDFKKMLLLIGIIILIFCSVFYYTHVYFSILPNVLIYINNNGNVLIYINNNGIDTYMLLDILFVIAPGIIPLIIAYLIIKKVILPYAVPDKTQNIKSLPMLISSFAFFLLFFIGYDLYIHDLFSGKEALDRLEESLVNVSNIITYLLMNSLPYFIFLILGLFSMFIFMRNNEKTRNYLFAAILCFLIPIFCIDWSILSYYSSIEYRISTTSFIVDHIHYIIPILAGLYFIYIFIYNLTCKKYKKDTKNVGL